MRRLPGEEQRTQIGNDWDLVVIDVDRVSAMQVIYQSHTGQTRRGLTRSSLHALIPPDERGAKNSPRHQDSDAQTSSAEPVTGS